MPKKKAHLLLIAGSILVAIAFVVFMLITVPETQIEEEEEGRMPQTIDIR